MSASSYDLAVGRVMEASTVSYLQSIGSAASCLSSFFLFRLHHVTDCLTALIFCLQGR